MRSRTPAVARCRRWRQCEFGDSCRRLLANDPQLPIDFAAIAAPRLKFLISPDARDRLTEFVEIAECFAATSRFLPTLRRRSEEHTSELQSLTNLVCRLLLEKKKNTAT